MLTTYNLKMPHAVYGGENAMDNITTILKTNGVKRVAMFTDKGIEGAGLFALPEEAVKAARKLTRPGHSCLLSPAAASYGIFRNFEERGEEFARLALEEDGDF